MFGQPVSRLTQLADEGRGSSSIGFIRPVDDGGGT